MLFVVVTVSVEVPAVEIVAGENDPDAPVGRPETDSVTVPMKPARAPTVVVYVVEPPAVTVCELGVAVSEKSTSATPWVTTIDPLVDSK